MAESCFAERDGRIFTITINRPERMNALHPPGNAEMAELFDEFQMILNFGLLSSRAPEIEPLARVTTCATKQRAVIDPRCPQVGLVDSPRGGTWINP